MLSRQALVPSDDLKRSQQPRRLGRCRYSTEAVPDPDFPLKCPKCGYQLAYVRSEGPADID